MSKLQILTKGIIKENPSLILVLGMCPTLGVTTSAENGIGMGIATTFVLLLSNIMISLVKGVIPDKVRIPSFIVIIATFVSIVDLLVQGFVPALAESLGLFIPLIVVNCIVLGRAEAFASKNGIFDSMLDGLGMGLGFTLSLFIIGACREILGSGAIFGHKFITGDGILIFVLAPGAFFVLGFVMALVRHIQNRKKSSQLEKR
ncbi:MAG: electron transport complex subunit E [Bacteroidales bacterium]|nr:electron transport complex subunit E [Bacteroidales bacterium]